MTKTLRELDTTLDELAGSLPAQLADLRPDEHADALAPSSAPCWQTHRQRITIMSGAGCSASSAMPV